MFGAVELLSDEFPIPSQDSVGLGDARDLREHFASNRFPISAGVARSGLRNRSLVGSFALKIRFSAAGYSFCSNSSWFTGPIAYAGNCSHFLFFNRPAYLTLSGVS